MNEENNRNHNVDVDAVGGSVDRVSREEVIQVINDIKTVKSPGPSYVSLQLLAATGILRIHVMVG